MHTRELAELEKLSGLLDSKFRLPGTSIRFGWDTIVGLIPGVGDAATAVPAAYLLFKAYQMGARRRTIARMAMNTGLDLTLGAVPLVGDLLDLFFKSNIRNVELLKADIASRDDAATLREKSPENAAVRTFPGTPPRRRQLESG